MFYRKDLYTGVYCEQTPHAHLCWMDQDGIIFSIIGTSPYQTLYETDDVGTRTLTVRPTMTGGCVRSIGRTINF